ncbi:MAG: hypothetical protein ACOYOU_01340 [Kiritimatiellia bacterium]
MKTTSVCRCTKGQALVMVLIIMMIAMALSVPMFNMGKQAARMPVRWRNYDQSFFTALSAMERVKWDMNGAFTAFYTAAPLPRSILKFTWFDTCSTNQIGSVNPYLAPQGATFSNAIIWVSILGVRTISGDQRDVTVHLKCQYNGVVREVEEVMRFRRMTSGVFDYAYFINNFGWFWGNTITANGAVRANGNFSFNTYTPVVNGDIYAGINPENGATGIIDGSNMQSWQLTNNYYYSHTPTTARPGSPTSNSATAFAGSDWPMGYNGKPTSYKYQQSLEMPYLGDLSDYTWLASNRAGMVYQIDPITQATNILINMVYTNAGPSGVMTNLDGSPKADVGCIMLDGTVNPIRIKGPVVVKGDLVIKGKFSGQGTIYAGRNIYIAGNLTATNAPAWPKPDATPDTTMVANSQRDMLGLCAKGNTLMGDYTDSSWDSNVSYYSRPPFTAPYKIDNSDLSNGYGSYQDANGEWWFNGNYTASDGGSRVSGSGTAPRTFLTSSIDAATFKAFAQPTRVARVDAVMYNNHLLSGLIGDSSGMLINGSVISRDEAMIYYNTINLNWDIRLGSTSKEASLIDIFLPGTLAPPQTACFREL